MKSKRNFPNLAPWREINPKSESGEEVLSQRRKDAKFGEMINEFCSDGF